VDQHLAQRHDYRHVNPLVSDPCPTGQRRIVSVYR
jgi:hypothetical protein